MLVIEVFSPIRLFSECVAASLNSLDDFNVDAPADSVDALIENLEQRRPDLLLVDVASRDIKSGIAMVVGLWPDLPVVAVALPDDPVEVIACAEAGFSAYLPGRATMEMTCHVILAAARGEMICSGRVASTLMREIHRRPKPMAPGAPDASLTARQREIVKLLAEDRSNKWIARELSISLATVKNHVHNILRKLGAGHRRAAVACLQTNPELLQGNLSGALSKQIGLSPERAIHSLRRCAIPSAASTAHPR